MPAEVPALPAFAMQRVISTMIRDLGHDYWTGTVYTTNRRVWEHDEAFKDYLRKLRCMAIDMEPRPSRRRLRQFDSFRRTVAGLRPADDSGRREDGSVRQKVTDEFVEAHITIGIEALKLVRRHGKSVKHLRFDE